MRSLSDSWKLGGIDIANRLVLAPLAGIGNWFVRLQAKRHGAGLVVSEMVSSFGVKYGNERTTRQFLRIHPDEHPVSIQLFGQDPDVMREAAAAVAAAGADVIDLNMGCPVRKVCKTGAGAALLQDPDVMCSAAAHVARAGADVIDLNMGCPVPKVCKTGAGAALLGDPDRAVAVATAAREGSGLPVTVKLRSGRRRGEREGFELAHRLVTEAGVAAIAFHPRSAQVHHKGEPDLELAAELVRTLPAPVILSGGMRDPAWILDAFRRTGCAAVMLARGALGNPWLFARLLDDRVPDPSAAEVLDELDWVLECAAEHLGPERAARYLRKFYPWYVERLGAPKAVRERLQHTSSLDEAQTILGTLRAPASLAA